MRLPLLALLFAAALAAQQNDEAYTAKIKQFTTETFLTTELVDHLPASSTVPTPEKILGYIVGAPNHLTYTKDIYRYLRELEKATKRVKVFVVGHSEEGREILVVAVSDEANIANLDHYRDLTARLADPRKTTDAQAAQIVNEALPMYWLSGSIHSPETGAPEMLMELAYRLAVEDTPLVQNIRKNSITLITPASEVDGRDRAVDVYRYRKENPGKPAPNQIYWGKYVAHDNNRDGLGMALELSKAMMAAFLQFHPTVLHDLHESEPFLYVSTGMGPYNAWLDPIVIDEWQKMAYVEIEELTKRGVPGVWTHGFYDGWAPNYMFYVANGHNSIGRFYETFGGNGADTGMRTVAANATSRTWFRPNPPLPRVYWSLRDNVNLQQSGLLFAMNNTANNRKQFLENFYLKSKRSVAKAATEGPAAWIIPGDDPRPGNAAGLVNLLRNQAIEVHKLNADAEVAVDKAGTKKKFPAGSYVIRMDQPYSRMGDMLLDTQYYNVTDPPPYDDTGWTLGPLHNVGTVRVTNAEILKQPMTILTAEAKPAGKLAGPPTAAAYIVNHNADNILATFRFKLHEVKMFSAEDGFKDGDKSFNAGSFIIKTDGNPANLRTLLDSAAAALGVPIFATAAVPTVAMHELQAPRVALVHTWINTQNEGWFRIAFDRNQIPYEYIADQKLKDIPNLRAKYDVILFGPVQGSAQRIVNGAPMFGEPIPWKPSALMPNVAGSPDTTDDMRPGMGLQGLTNIAKFIDDGGLFITITGNASIPIDYGLVEGVTVQSTPDLHVRGSVLSASVADRKSPIAYGYSDKLALYFNTAPVFQAAAGGGGGGRGGGGGGGGRGGRGGAATAGDGDVLPGQNRPSGRGTMTEQDTPQGRPEEMGTPDRPGDSDAGGGDAAGGGGGRGGAQAPPEMRPRIVVRFASEEKDLLISGMLTGGRPLVNAPAVIDVPHGKGHVLLFANNPMWRSETNGSYFLIWNALMNYDHLSAGVPAAPAAGRGGRGARGGRGGQ